MKGIQLIEFPVLRISSTAPLNFRPFSDQNPLSKSAAARPEDPRLVPAPEWISRVPFLHPVLLLETPHGPLVVDGHRRLAAAHREGLPRVPAILLPDRTEKEVVIFLSLSGRAGSLSGVERIVALQKTVLYAENGQALRAAGSFTTVPDRLVPLYSWFFARGMTSAYLSRLLEVLKFPSEELGLLHTLDVPADQLTALLDLHAHERRALLLLQSRMPFTASDTRILVRLLLALRGRRGFDLERWIEGRISSFPAGLRGRDIASELRAFIHPTLTARKTAIEKDIKSLRLPPSFTLRPPENLEGETFSCYFRFSSVEEIERQLNRIQRAINEGAIDKLIKGLNGD